jgi:ubiquitin thioesterase OTU1
VKAGYPPKELTIVSQLPLESLGLKPGDQLIVSELPDASTNPVTQSPPSGRRSDGNLSAQPTPAYTPSVSAFDLPTSVPPSADYVDTDGGVLIHRVSLTCLAVIDC